MTQAIDQGSRATITAANAQAALDRGDTSQAQREFAEAGEILEREMRGARDEETEHLLRFLAATQFYKGGHYAKACELAEKIKGTKLPANTRRLLPDFVRDVKDRSAPDYPVRIHARGKTVWDARDYDGVLKLLAEHPYVLSPVDLAFIRAACCEALGKYRAAVLFFADAARLAPDDPAVISALVALPLQMSARGKLDQAWEYVQVQLELFPNAASTAAASLVCYHLARNAGANERLRYFTEQARLFERAREEFSRLPEAHRAHPEVKMVLEMGYDAAVFALMKQGRHDDALRLCDEAIAFAPPSFTFWRLRGVLTCDTPEAESAFRKALSLGDRSYFPHYYLAYHAVKHGNYAEARDAAREALERVAAKNKNARSLLYQWQAISLDNLGANRSEVEDLFKKAIEADTDNPYAQDNYQRFLASEKSIATPPSINWPGDFSPNNDPLLTNGDATLFDPDRKAGQIERRLMGLAG
jgi:tetratricopeptide (TPR) repeat protein